MPQAGALADDARHDSSLLGGIRAGACLAVDEATLLGYANDAVEVGWFPAGFSMVEQGERGNILYLIISGHATVIHEDGRGTRHLRRLSGPGQLFSAEALALRGTHDASVVASDTVIGQIRKEAFAPARAGGSTRSNACHRGLETRGREVVANLSRSTGACWNVNEHA